MKLWYSPASPFVRKCLIAAHERGLADRIELVNAAANVVDPDQRIVQSNPTGKIPTMLLEDGTVRPVYFYVVDMSEFSADKLANRGSAQAQAILTNVQDFIVNLWNHLK